jgi:hypothetical protein
MAIAPPSRLTVKTIARRVKLGQDVAIFIWWPVNDDKIRFQGCNTLRGLIFACPKTSPAQTSDDPADTVRIIYNTKGTEHLAQFWSPRMQPLWAKQNGLGYAEGALDFDYKYDSQDADVHDLKIAIIHRLETDAEVRVTFNQLGKPDELRYDLVRYNGAWVIDDVRKVGPNDPWVLSEILKLNN